jgi:multidrug efflux pump subunit AcrA (membrane-fusion protein)
MRVESDLALTRLRQETQVQNAQDAVALAKLKADQMLIQLRAKREAIVAALKLEETKLTDIQEDLANCQLLAPNDGTVMYHEPAARRGVAPQWVIAAGEPVREGQKLLSIWKPGPMLMRIRVEESLVARLQPGQRTMITIPAIKQSLAGKVQSISPIAAAPEGPATETRYYPVVIAITETSEMLRPSMAAQASIIIDEQKNIMRVPLHAITLKDGVPHCFVKKDDGIHERKVTVGVTGSTHVEIKSGVEAGDEVVVSIPRTAPTGFGPGASFPGGGRGPADR